MKFSSWMWRCIADLFFGRFGADEENEAVIKFLLILGLCEEVWSDMYHSSRMFWLFSTAIALLVLRFAAGLKVGKLLWMLFLVS